MSDEANGAEVYLYVISCGLERIKIGVASDARKRLRELQVGSPVELKVALTRPYAERRDADAVAQELYRSFGGRDRRVALRRGGEPVRARTEKQLAYERRRRQERTRKQKRAARLLGQGMTQQAVAVELGVTTRTLRNWKAAPVFPARARFTHHRTRSCNA